MIFQNSFRRFIANLGFSSNPVAQGLLGAAFEAGENAVLGEQQVPTLLKPQSTFKAVSVEPILTQAQINYLLKVTANAATVFQEENETLKRYEQFAWFHSDKETEVGQMAFGKLNEIRNARRKLAKHRDRINGIIVALKKAR